MLGIIKELPAKAKITRRHEAHRRFNCCVQAKLEKNRHQGIAPATTAVGHRHPRALNNGGKMKICNKHQTFEVIR